MMMMVSSKLNIRTIFRDHLATLKDGVDEQTSLIDVLTFFGLPLLVAVLFWLLTQTVAESTADRIDSIVVSAFSIFAALLLNIQVLIINLRTEKISEAEVSSRREDVAWDQKQKKFRAGFLLDVFSNVSYAIAICIALVALTLLLIFCGWDRVPLAKAAQLYLIVHFVLTLLMILKRMHIVLGAQLR